MKKEPILILANPQGNAWNFAKGVYNKLSSQKHEPDNFLYGIYQKITNSKESEKDYELRKVEINRFNNKEIIPRILKSVREKNCFFIHDASMYPQDWLVSLMFLKDNLERCYAKQINLILPGMPYTRQDRITSAREPISLGVVANVLKGTNVRIMTTDIHNPSSAIAFKPFENLKAYPVIIDYLKKNYQDFLENCLIVSPDAGAMQVANSYSKRLDLGIVSGYKKRDKPGIIGKIEIMGEVKNKNVLMTDDLIDTAGTLCKCAEILKEKGANRIWACATHGIFSYDKKEKRSSKEKLENSPLEKIIITDSIPQKSKDKIEVVSLTNLLAEVIYRTSNGISISELYE